MCIGIVGDSGKMGRLLKRLLQGSSTYSLGDGFSRSSPYPLQHVISTNHYLIDFSSPWLTDQLVDLLLDTPKPLITGTTGLSSSLKHKLTKLSETTPVIVCPNTSLGAHIQRQFASLLAKWLDNSFDIRISEVHHREKRDIPSGTAQHLAASICRSKKEHWGEQYTTSSEGDRKNRIEMFGSRAGSAPGEHEVTFISDKELISIRHVVFSREVFAKGVINLLDWLVREKPSKGIFGAEVLHNLS